MEILTDKAAMRAWSRRRRAEGLTLGFVPTMGYLHEGHLSLVRLARQRSDRVAVSIYVNPTQFAPGEDFDVYPRDAEGDLAKLRAEGVDVVFTPDDLYVRTEPAHETWVRVTELERPMCGVSRPSFFRGVATVVSKLLNVVEPDVAVFGKKDYQQWRLIQRMVRDLDFAVEIAAGEIVREADGLAMSSRNARLSADQRARAVAIARALTQARDRVATGETDAAALKASAYGHITAAGGRVDYVEIRDAHSLREVDHVQGLCVMAAAAFFGDVRLIDNVELSR